MEFFLFKFYKLLKLKLKFSWNFWKKVVLVSIQFIEFRVFLKQNRSKKYDQYIDDIFWFNESIYDPINLFL